MSKGTEFPFRAPITKMLGQQDCSGGRYCPLCCAVPDLALPCVLGDAVSVLLDDVGIERAAFPQVVVAIQEALHRLRHAACRDVLEEERR